MDLKAKLADDLQNAMNHNRRLARSRPLAPQLTKAPANLEEFGLLRGAPSVPPWAAAIPYSAIAASTLASFPVPPKR